MCFDIYPWISINLVQGNCTSFTHNHSMDETLDNKGEKLKNAMQYKFIQKCYDLEQKTKPFWWFKLDQGKRKYIKDIRDGKQTIKE